MTRAEYIAKNNRRQALFEKRYVKPMYAVLKSQMTQAADVVRRSGPDGLALSLSSLAFNENVGPVIEQIYLEAGIYYARKTRTQINVSKREGKAAGFGVDEQWTQEIINYLRNNIVSKAVLPISNTTKARILQILEKGRTEGWGVDRMAFELENDGLTLARARLIVRTELKMAENKGREMAMEESEFETVKTWISADDHRTRIAHREVDGAEVDSKGRFKVKRYKGKKFVGYDFMTGPGDPTAHAENNCNCRCTESVRVKRDADGRMIKRRKIFVALPGEFTRQTQILTI